MRTLHHPSIALSAGGAIVVLIAVVAGQFAGPDLAGRLSRHAQAAITAQGGDPITAHFVSPGGWPSRHPLLSGGDRLNDSVRDRTAKTIAALPGVGGVRWEDGGALAQTTGEPPSPRHCEDDVEALLRSRTIRFEEGAARIDAASRPLVAEVAAALRPCLGSIISITGHTDSSGPEPGNLALSLERAQAVQQALIDRGIPPDGLRVRGLGSRSPVQGLLPTDPANRRIEFAVIAIEPITPTPVDIPGPR